MNGIARLILWILAVSILNGCQAMKPDDTLAGDVRGYNHTAKGINWFRVNGPAGLA